MKAMMLCAGYATRLYPLTKDKPKPLLPLAGRPMINYLIDKLQAIRELDEMCVVTNAKFFDHFQEWKEQYYPREPIHVLNDHTDSNETRLGAIRDMNLALKSFNAEDDILVLASDNYFDSDLNQFAQNAVSHRPAATLAVYDVKDLKLATKYGLISHDNHYKITQFFEKPKHPTTTLASTGVYFFPKENLKLIDQFLAGNQNPDAPGHYIKWLSERTEVFAFPFEGTWYDIGDFESYRKADTLVRQAFKS
ncbi:MAG: nucleoside-diphosphate-sugar pyrophosphorylase [Candidatus Omnitrophica bacterium CG11_big_fil_rev_8_21_14_0_20_45_26]|uniref:Nucleoside-diphosphate-sugar pyrophosphorylase n=1 Tax=Candidatus Abzuiibacterium crystallinum TaxID=1974748 RepID=A0A2H0LMQ9_9BACT|nr:MAG: nucleoside-diphosphate-sugar pyrophosphorylase [Candidatus Omnitrophica bacterium CG11_big_fil_rev_8_21_14_0_20_45_26]PIW65215.1 MAG: nucleoside-diphosphate-sugar pyrophosphorylase [Candidatus Omnitrophica bacterium CG12_big_fil_rev_8_21_14_0_65_45_16]